MAMLKKMAARLPGSWQTELKRSFFGIQIRRGTFATDEPEYKILHTLVNPGDWVIDIGANVGHYTKRLSDLAGPTGRVIAFEPVPTTFALLSSNAQLFRHANVTLINAAASAGFGVAGMSMPKFASGLTNYYEAHLSTAAENELSVLTISLDALCLDRRIALIKIDAEGHESLVLGGMKALLEAHHPILIVETGSKDVIEGLSALSYVPEKREGSPNILFKPR